MLSYLLLYFAISCYLGLSYPTFCYLMLSPDSSIHNLMPQDIICYLVLWNIQDHEGQYTANPEQMGPFWTIQGQTGPYETIHINMEP